MSAPIAPFFLGTRVIYHAGALSDFPATVVGWTDKCVRVRYRLPDSWRGVRIGKPVGDDPMWRESAVYPRSLSICDGGAA